MGQRYSIVICNYNHGPWVLSAVGSALAQTYPAAEYEVIVVDDGSTDDSRDRLAQLQSDRPPGQLPVLHVVHQARVGQAGALHRGVQLAVGDFVCLLDSDDVFDLDKLRSINSVLDAQPFLKFLIHNVRVLDQARGAVLDQLLLPVPMGAGKTVVRLLEHPEAVHFPVPCGVVLRRDTALDLLEQIPRDDWWQGADGTLNLAAWLLIGEVGILDRPLATYRVHVNNHFALMADGALSSVPRSQRRGPKRLALVERLIDAADLEPEHRQAAQHAVAQVARNMRLRSDSPRATQLVRRSETWELDDAKPLWPAVAQRVANSSASYIHFSRARDKVHPWFHERMAHLHATMPALVVGCDFALHGPEGERLREHVLLTHSRTSRGTRCWSPYPDWKSWPLGPLSSLSFRLSPMVRAWVAHCDLRASPHARRFPSILLAGGLWALGGAALADESWVSVWQADADVLVSLTAGDALADAVDCPLGRPFAWLDLPMLLVGFVIEAPSGVRSQLPPGWNAALARWAREKLPTPLCEQLAHHAERADLKLVARLLRDPAAAGPRH